MTHNIEFKTSDEKYSNSQKMCSTILRPRDVNSLQNQTLKAPPLDHHRRRNDGSDKSRRQKKITATGMKNSSNRSLVEKIPTRDLVMEKVTILKRGEELKIENDDDVKDRRFRDSVIDKRTVRFAEKDDLVVCSTDRAGPEPETMSMPISVHEMKVIGGCVYAGPGSVVCSPPPCSVPVPLFCANKVATTDLLRILKLDDLMSIN